MIKYHPNSELLLQYVQGALPASISVAIAAHLELCAHCAEHTDTLEQQCAHSAFADEQIEASELAYEQSHNEDALGDEYAAMLADITADDLRDDFSIASSKELRFGDKTITLPRALSHIGMGRFMQAGKLARSRLELDEGSMRTSLLYIAPGGTIPEHTHTGFELTLLLDGSFSDEQGTYEPGDFMWLDHRHQHTPYTEHGCLCLAVVNSALHFNKGLSKLLNPIGELIY
ncbi:MULTISPECIES: ChrR family anti-sigma-E factor [unclassified Pseudoalteromonas]|uniref:ChrR family anti-sigma-E factor n=1 Tax=unclassified Pseudoalteromonas TaxID=194690 RepID=UPI000CF5FF30|nr:MULTISPECIES: ChrR family anti-sigma-E factor [unclassified Pseudoalteromonas]